ncbi:hypothetical protein [Paraburkholderia sp. J67]|uniref:hypothetical protein n=1 Tax=Paraburkholderia sp. J67 TaxID=2805435 RepID=UPI002ABE8727|nr:hypothetical protein [Paraburkholderia sp. J67]
MASIISDLWENETLPVKSGVYFSDGRSIEIRLESFPAPTIEIGCEFNFTEFYSRNKDELTSIDCLKILQLSSGGVCCVGEGGYGSEGFISRLDEDGNLVWVIYSEKSNPFIDIFEIDDGYVVAKSSARYALKIALDNPIKIGLCE